MSNINLVSFLDAAQRTIIGEKVEGGVDELKIKNPVVVNIVPQLTNGQPNGQMALQLLPLYFREFQGEKTAPTIFSYPKNQITLIDFEGGFDFRLYGQYEHIFNPAAVAPAAAAPAAAAPVLKLFDE